MSATMPDDCGQLRDLRDPDLDSCTRFRVSGLGFRVQVSLPGSLEDRSRGRSRGRARGRARYSQSHRKPIPSARRHCWATQH